MDEAFRNVLIVDDDPQILRLVEKMLKARKVRILVAPRPSDALEICETQRVHLLITDVAMPEMDGPTLAERVLERQPEAYVLLISGHFKDPPAMNQSGRMRFLKKPFFPSQLIEHLHELLPEI
jgi:two-component system cell cycle sensor histidine kinase/response regulator CckA